MKTLTFLFLTLGCLACSEKHGNSTATPQQPTQQDQADDTSGGQQGASDEPRDDSFLNTIVAKYSEHALVQTAPYAYNWSEYQRGIAIPLLEQVLPELIQREGRFKAVSIDMGLQNWQGFDEDSGTLKIDGTQSIQDLTLYLSALDDLGNFSKELGYRVDAASTVTDIRRDMKYLSDIKIKEVLRDRPYVIKRLAVSDYSRLVAQQNLLILKYGDKDGLLTLLNRSDFVLYLIKDLKIQVKDNSGNGGIGAGDLLDRLMNAKSTLTDLAPMISAIEMVGLINQEDGQSTAQYEQDSGRVTLSVYISDEDFQKFMSTMQTHQKLEGELRISIRSPSRSQGDFLPPTLIYEMGIALLANTRDLLSDLNGRVRVIHLRGLDEFSYNPSNKELTVGATLSNEDFQNKLKQLLE